MGAAVGMVAGGAAGAIAGPIGMAVGAAIGAVIGEAAGEAIHERSAEESKRDHELDDAIGVTSGRIGAGEVEGFRGPPKASTFLRADHDFLESRAERAIQAISEGDHDDVAAIVQELQVAVLGHLDGEERDLLPAYRIHDPEAAELILKDHAAIRKTLAELDVATDLHLIRSDAVRAFLDALRAHARRENAGLYRWAAASPDAP